MNLEELAAEYTEARASFGLVLDEAEVFARLLEATRFYAGYGDIRSLSGSDTLPGAPVPGVAPAPLVDDPVILGALPVKLLDLITGDTVLSVGEWSIVRPLFVLYVERENAIRLESSRVMGGDPYGRSVAEVAGEIAVMESETIPNKTGAYALITVS